MLNPSFIELLKGQLGEQGATELINNLDSDSPTSIRINPAKISNINTLDNLSFEPSDNVISKYGYQLTTRGNFTLDPLFHSGCYYVQEASSMAVELALPYITEHLGNQKIAALDLCAAPGGKSTHLLSMLRSFPSSFLVSNEVINTRASILAENIEKWGAANIVVSNNDPKDFKNLSDFFNFIIVDAPCSGEGMFRKDPKTRTEWSIESVELCAARQKRIVADIWPSLVDGGLMIYSTCTFNRFENSDNVEWIASELGAEILMQRQFYPKEGQAGEGFFFALLKKNGEYCPKNNKTLNNFKTKLTLFKVNKSWLKGDFNYYLKGDLLKAYPSEVCQQILFVESKLKAIRSGTAIAKLKGKDLLIPEHSLSLSQNLDYSAFENVDLNLETAIQYLQKEPLSSFALKDAPLGYILLTYKNIPIGFVKNIGSRTNSLFPSSWRIKSNSLSQS